jgi:hypothetical protein
MPKTTKISRCKVCNIEYSLAYYLDIQADVKAYPDIKSCLMCGHSREDLVLFDIITYSQEEYDNKSISWDKVDSIESAEGKLVNIKVLQRLRKELKKLRCPDCNCKKCKSYEQDIDSLFAEFGFDDSTNIQKDECLRKRLDESVTASRSDDSTSSSLPSAEQSVGVDISSKPDSLWSRSEIQCTGCLCWQNELDTNLCNCKCHLHSKSDKELREICRRKGLLFDSVRGSDGL